MDTYLTNLTSNDLDIFSLHVSSPVIMSLQIINISLGLPLNISVIILLLTKDGGIGGSVIFTLSQVASEIIFANTAPLFILCHVNVMHLCFVKPVIFFIGFCLTVRFFLQCCVGLDRYLAVVHPIVFLKYKPVKYKLQITIVIWVYSFIFGIVTMAIYDLPYNVFGIFYAIVLQVHFFFCFSILRVLSQPGPGRTERDNNGASIFKKKAFEVVTFNLLTFLAQFIPIAVAFAAQKILSVDAFASGFTISIGINITVGFVQPLFFLHQTGKVMFIR